MTFTNHIGQNHLKPLLEAEINAAKSSNEPLRHMIFYGLPGLGKSTLARLIAQEMGGEYIRLDGSTYNPKDVTTLLLSLSTSGYTANGLLTSPESFNRFPVIFLDEAHAQSTLEPWYIALEEFHVSSKGLTAWVPYFTLISATTVPQKLSKPFVDRCPLAYELLPYTEAELAEIIRQRIPEVSEETAREVAQRSRGIARLALSHARSRLNYGPQYFEARGIDERGLTDLDRQYLAVLESAHAPLALQTLAYQLNREPAVIEQMVEPYLLQCGLVQRTPKGRVRLSEARGCRHTTPSDLPNADTAVRSPKSRKPDDTRSYGDVLKEKGIAVVGGRASWVGMEPSRR